MTGSFLVCGWFLSYGFGNNGVEIDHIDHVVEFPGLVLGEWLPVAWPVYGAVEGDGPVWPDEPNSFLDFNTVQIADDRSMSVAYVTSCEVCGVEWVDFGLSVEAGE